MYSIFGNPWISMDVHGIVLIPLPPYKTMMMGLFCDFCMSHAYAVICMCMRKNQVRSRMLSFHSSFWFPLSQVLITFLAWRGPQMHRPWLCKVGKAQIKVQRHAARTAQSNYEYFNRSEAKPRKRRKLCPHCWNQCNIELPELWTPDQPWRHFETTQTEGN